MRYEESFSTNARVFMTNGTVVYVEYNTFAVAHCLRYFMFTKASSLVFPFPAHWKSGASTLLGWAMWFVILWLTQARYGVGVHPTFWLTFIPFLHSVLLYYVVQYYLLPRFLLLGRYRIPTVLLALDFIGLNALNLIGTEIIYVEWKPISPVFTTLNSMQLDFSGLREIISGPVYLSVSTYAYYALLPISVLLLWVYREQKRGNILLQNRNIELEIKNLKRQIHPDFLMGQLSAIQESAKTDPALAADGVLGLADVMRYLLYGANNTSVSLYRELEVLQAYWLLRARVDASRLDYRLETEGNLEGLIIKPMALFIPMENLIDTLNCHRASGSLAVDIRIRGKAEGIEVVCSFAPEEMPIVDNGLAIPSLGELMWQVDGRVFRTIIAEA